MNSVTLIALACVFSAVAGMQLHYVAKKYHLIISEWFVAAMVIVPATLWAAIIVYADGANHSAVLGYMVFSSLAAYAHFHTSISKDAQNWHGVASWLSFFGTFTLTVGLIDLYTLGVAPYALTFVATLSLGNDVTRALAGWSADQRAIVRMLEMNSVEAH